MAFRRKPLEWLFAVGAVNGRPQGGRLVLAAEQLEQIGLEAHGADGVGTLA